jgi:ketosteroid isomerase-like protein
MTMARTSDPSRKNLVSEWTEAFNRRDLHGMLMRLDRDVDFHPSIVSGVRRRYRGHEGVQDWFAQLVQAPQAFRVVLREVSDVGPNVTLAAGSLTLPGAPDAGPFFALHQIRDGVIVAIHEYVTGHELVELIGRNRLGAAAAA